LVGVGRPHLESLVAFSKILTVSDETIEQPRLLACAGLAGRTNRGGEQQLQGNEPLLAIDDQSTGQIIRSGELLLEYNRSKKMATRLAGKLGICQALNITPERLPVAFLLLDVRTLI